MHVATPYPFAMGVHAKGNDRRRLAIDEQSYDFLEVAFAVLRRGDPEIARAVIAFVLDKSGQRGCRKKPCVGWLPEACWV